MLLIIIYQNQVLTKKKNEIIEEVISKLIDKVPIGPKRIPYKEKIEKIIKTIKSNNKLNISSIEDYIEEVHKRLSKK